MEALHASLLSGNSNVSVNSKPVPSDKSAYQQSAKDSLMNASILPNPHLNLNESGEMTFAACSRGGDNSTPLSAFTLVNKIDK